MARDRVTRVTKVTQSPSDARHHRNTFRDRPDLPHEVEPHPPGYAVCTGCHAIWEHKHWTLDEERYRRLVDQADMTHVQCPGCMRVERQEYDGEVTLKSPLIPKNEEAVLGLIYNTERHIRAHNPIARIAQLTIEGDTIHVLTITPFLAERIGKELNKAYGGEVNFSHPERQEFIRVTWYREE